MRTKKGKVVEGLVGHRTLAERHVLQKKGVREPACTVRGADTVLVLTFAQA